MIDRSRPVLYLDFDGVFIVPEWKCRPRVRCVQVLNSLIRETNCVIVMSTSQRSRWKERKEVEYVLSKHGLVCDLLGRTGYGLLDKPEWGLNAREHEIYVDAQQRGLRRWCAVDDSVHNCLRRMVRVTDPIGVGFHEAEAEQAYLWLTTEDEE